jgi:uncharacterized Zn finger protein
MSTHEQEIICPNCGNEDNFHFNYDYTKKELPIINILCNECGNFFELKTN